MFDLINLDGFPIWCFCGGFLFFVYHDIKDRLDL